MNLKYWFIVTKFHYKPKIPLTDKCWLSQMLSAMGLYTAVQCTQYTWFHSVNTHVQYLDNQCCGSEPVLICIRKLNTNCIVIFTYCKYKTKQLSLHNFTVLIILTTIIHKNTPNSLWKKSRCPNPKKASKKVATFEKTTVLCRSTFFISL